MAESMKPNANVRRAVVPAVVWLTILYAIVAILFYWQTSRSMVTIWDRMGTYTHGYLIVPITLWLIWDKRSEMTGHYLKPVIWIQSFAFLAGLVWLLAHLANVQVVQQLALVTIIIVGIWSIVGHELARIVSFPLGFLFMAVPMGEDLVPPMMEFTATSTVWLIKLTGIPVYREGLYFTLPSGNWSVVQACSGVRYLIASFTLGILYAYLSYRSLGKRLLFVLISLLVPVLANSARAFIIVMLGHYSDMRIATGVDHLVYGWVFFGLVMFLLFWIGSYWQDDRHPSESSGSASLVRTGQRPPRKAFAAFFSANLIAGFFPLLMLMIEHSSVSYSSVDLSPPPPIAEWEHSHQPEWEWQPRDFGADSHLMQFYRHGENSVALYLQQYIGQKEGAELAGGKISRFLQEKYSWRLLGQETISAILIGEEIDIRQARLSDGRRNLMLWYWFRIGDRYTANQYVAKLFEALESLTFGRKDAALIMLATEFYPGETAASEAGKLLQNFVSDQLPAIEASLDATVQ